MSTPSSSATVNLLKQAADGLLFMSESDYPFEGFLWQGQAPLTPEKLLDHLGQPSDTAIEVVALDDFFEPATEELDWYGPEERDTAKRFRQLLATIQQQLPDAKVYRVGSVEITVVIVGQVEDDVVGLTTKVVET